MYVDKNSIIGGLPAKKARDYFKSIETNSFHHNSLDQDIFPSMLDEGLVEIDPFNPELHRITNLAIQTSHANFLKPMTRKQADVLMNRVLERADMANKEFSDNPFFLKGLVLFGSYLSDAPTLGDIDLAPVLDTHLNNEELFAACQDYSESYGPESLSFLARITYPQNVFTKFLKGRSPRLDFCPMDNIVSLRCPFKVVWSGKTIFEEY